MSKETQISAQISDTTRELMDKQYVVHPRIVVSRKTGEQMLRQAASADPSPALRKLMRDGD
jgi:hypothetical protein